MAARVGRWVALAALVVLAAACSGGTTDSTATDGREVTDEVGAPAFGGDEATQEGAATEAAPQAEDAQEPAATGQVDAAAQAPVPDPGVAATGERIIKEGTVTIAVEEGTFDQAFQALIQRAQALGGHVVGSSSSTDDEGFVTGSVTVRVPVAAYEDLLTGLGDVGTVTDRTVTSQDVTTQYVDLESRLRHLRAQEAFYLDLLTEAQTVQDAIAVQQQLDGIQGQIEQITGQLNLLDDRTAFSTLTANVVEEGADTSALTTAEDEAEGLGHYWDVAREVIVDVIGTILVVLLFLAPFLAIAVVGLLGWRALRPRRAPTLGDGRAQRPAEQEPQAGHDTADVG